MPYLGKMVKIEDVMFWILILVIVAIALWLLSGSPPEVNALISITLFVATSELFLWRKLFEIDKKSMIGFVKVRHQIDEIKSDMNNRFNNIDNKLDIIQGRISK